MPRALILAALAALALAPSASAQQAPAPEVWQIIIPPQSSLVLARDGSLIGEIGREWRTSIAIGTLPSHVPAAFIAVEDQRFYQHDGVDMVGIAGLSELGTAVGAAAEIAPGTSVAAALQAAEPYTVFAPTNAAFQALTATPDAEGLRDVLLLHVVKAAAPVLSTGLPTTAVDTLLAGEQLTFDAAVPSVSSGGTAGAKIGPLDINVTNGVVHVIDKVLLPTP